jgi:hypothetical protein
VSSNIISKTSNFPWMWKVWTCSHGSSDRHRTLGKSSPESAFLKHHHSCLRPARDVIADEADIELSRYRKTASVASCFSVFRCTPLQSSFQNAVNVGLRMPATSYMPALPGQYANLEQLAFACSAVVRLKVLANMSQPCAIPPFSTNPRTRCTDAPRS